MRVLLAEDDSTSRKLVQTTLEQGGHSVVLTRDGVEAQEYLKKGHPLDALILDWMMPRMDGIELARWVRNSMSPPPPILFLSAIDSPDGIRYALEMGADDYLIKPVMPYEILRRLETLQNRLVQPLPMRPLREVPVLEHSEVLSVPKPVVPAPGGGIRPGTHPAEDIGVGIVAAAGGPKALIKLFSSLPTGLPASFYVVLHGPTWMTEHLSSSLQRQTGFRTRLVGDGRERRVGVIHLATQGQQVGFGGAAPIRFLLTDDPAENFVRPSADHPSPSVLLQCDRRGRWAGCWGRAVALVVTFAHLTQTLWLKVGPSTPIHFDKSVLGRNKTGRCFVDKKCGCPVLVRLDKRRWSACSNRGVVVSGFQRLLWLLCCSRWAYLGPMVPPRAKLTHPNWNETR